MATNSRRPTEMSSIWCQIETMASPRFSAAVSCDPWRFTFIVKPVQARIHHSLCTRKLFRRMSMTKSQNVIVTRPGRAAISLLALCILLVPVVAQQRQTLGALEFVGLKRLTRDQVVTMSG